MGKEGKEDEESYIAAIKSCIDGKLIVPVTTIFIFVIHIHNVIHRGGVRMKIMKKATLLILSFILLLNLILPATTSFAKETTTTYITVEEFLKKLLNSSKIVINTDTQNPIIDTAIEKDIIKKGEFTNYQSYITRQDVALVVNRVDELLHGETYDEKLYEQITSRKRISDLTKVTKSKQDAVVKIFLKGIMVGNSSGKCTQDRSFRGRDKLNAKEVTTILTRLNNISKRKKLSFDGQLIRTTDLPKNYKDFEYILASFPNSFYESKFDWMLYTYYDENDKVRKPIEFQDYVRPVNMKNKTFKTWYASYDMKDILDKNLDNWVEKIRLNLETRLNVDYRTVDNKWISTLRSTYYFIGDENYDKKDTERIKAYVNRMKKNKVILKAQVISVEPSSLYDSSGYYIRAYVKFKIVSANDLSEQSNIVFSRWGDSGVIIPNIKKNQWIEMYIDTNLGTQNAGSTGEDYGIKVDFFMQRN